MRSVRSARHAESRHQQPPSRRSRAVERQSLTPSPRRPRAIARAAPTAQRPRSRHGNRVPRRANVAKRPSTLPCPTAPKPLLSQNHLRCAVCSSPRGRRWSEHMRHSRLDIGAWCAVLLPPAQAIVSPASECRGKNPGGGERPPFASVPFHAYIASTTEGTALPPPPREYRDASCPDTAWDRCLARCACASPWRWGAGQCRRERIASWLVVLCAIYININRAP